MSNEERQKWVTYLTPEQTPTYGNYLDRKQEYEQVYTTLLMDLGFAEDALIIDIGAGSCDMDRYVRSAADFSFKYLPIDGATFGLDFNDPKTWKTFAKLHLYAEYYVSVETIEHLYDPRHLFNHIEKYATKGAVITTPNAAAGFDVQAQDPTHFSALTETTFKRFGYEVRQVEFSGRSQVEGQKDTLLAWKKFS